MSLAFRIYKTIRRPSFHLIEFNKQIVLSSCKFEKNILRKSPNCGMGPNFCIPTTPTFLKEVVNILQESGRVPHNALNIILYLQ